jgi:hypothetical protein
MAYTRQSGLAFKVEVLETFEGVEYSIGSGRATHKCFTVDD